VSTSKRPQVDDVQYPRVSNRILKGVLRGELVHDVAAEVAMSKVGRQCRQKFVELEHMDCRDIQISRIAAKSLAEPLEACRPQEGHKLEAPKYPGIPGRAIRRAPHMEAFIPDVKSWVPKTSLYGCKSTPTSEGHASEAPN
jgi:hypothetical protein